MSGWEYRWFRYFCQNEGFLCEFGLNLCIAFFCICKRAKFTLCTARLQWAQLFGGERSALAPLSAASMSTNRSALFLYPTNEGSSWEGVMLVAG